MRKSRVFAARIRIPLVRWAVILRKPGETEAAFADRVVAFAAEVDGRAEMLAREV